MSRRERHASNDALTQTMELARTRGFTEEEADLYSHVSSMLAESRHADYVSGYDRRKLRMFTRFAQGRVTALDVAMSEGWRVWDSDEPYPHDDRERLATLPWDEGRVASELQEWLADSRVEVEPYFWPGPPRHPWHALARQQIEAAGERRALYRIRLLLRLQVVGGRRTNEEAAKLARLPLGAWLAFCAAEDAADPRFDQDMRETWIVDVASEVVPASAIEEDGDGAR